MKPQFLIASLLCLFAVTPIVGCGGGGGEAKYDPSNVPAYDDAAKKEAEDYEAQMKKDFEEQYGN